MLFKMMRLLRLEMMRLRVVLMLEMIGLRVVLMMSRSWTTTMS